MPDLRLTATPPAAPDSLEDLLVATADRDIAAFTCLYDALAPRVHGIVLRVLRDPHQSDEVTQEVLLQVWDTAGRFDPARGSARAWVATLAHRRAVDRVRYSEAQHRRETVHAREAVETPYDQTATAVHASLEAQSVRSALEALTPVQRESIELAYFGGYTYREVASLMQAPIGTTKARIREGLHRLRASLVAQPA